MATLRSRRSEPTPPSAATSPRVKVPKQRGGWEFPLSREEKKQRVMYLFQAELAEAEKSNTEIVNEKLAEAEQRFQSLLEKRQPALSIAESATSSSTCRTGASGRTVKRRRLESCGLGLLAGLGVLITAWICQSAVSPVCSDITTSTMVLDPDAVPPNITDRVIGMRHEGHMRLQLSNCPEAQWWFSSALKLLSEEANVTEAYRNFIVGERGFALVCSQRYREGAKHLEQHLAFNGFHQGAVHLLNALGYAYFHMGNFTKASEVFELAIRAEVAHPTAQAAELNPVPWNNFAASLMMSGALDLAYSALVQADELVRRLKIHREHHATIIGFNGQLLRYLQERADTKELANVQSERMPWVELWNGYV